MRHRLLTRGLALAGLSLCFATGCSSGLPPVSQGTGNPAALPTGLPTGLPSLPTSLPSLPTALPSFGNPDQSLSGMHACKLVPASVVATVLGPLLDKPYETQDGLECFYTTAVPGGGGPEYILTIATRSDYEDAKAFAQGVAETDKAERYASSHNLGDDAFSTSTDTGGPDYSLWAVKAGVGIEVDVNDLGQGVSRAHDLAAAALTGL
jgi:hypothetical protein